VIATANRASNFWQFIWINRAQIIAIVGIFIVGWLYLRAPDNDALQKALNDKTAEAVSAQKELAGTKTALANAQQQISSLQSRPPVAQAPIPAPTVTQREFVGDLNFGALADRTKGLNGIEAGHIYAPYINKWVKLSGQINDITPAGNTGDIVVHFQAPTTNAGNAYMVFDRTKWTDRLGTRSRGDTLNAACRIE
jgi:hypothetical protein